LKVERCEGERTAGAQEEKRLGWKTAGRAAAEDVVVGKKVEKEEEERSRGEEE
jgi:hypothetical protein